MLQMPVKTVFTVVIAAYTRSFSNSLFWADSAVTKISIRGREGSSLQKYKIINDNVLVTLTQG